MMDREYILLLTLLVTLVAVTWLYRTLAALGAE